MKDEEIEAMKEIKLSTNQILLYLVDGFAQVSKLIDRHGLFRKDINDYFKWRELNRKKFSNDLKRLEREKVIKIYLDKNQGIIELTNKGKVKVRHILAKEHEYQYPKKWDRNWRIVIFDIPEKKKLNREIFRDKLEEIGFLKLQESVYIFPFDCKEVIDNLKTLLDLSYQVQYIVAQTVETQTDILDYFIKANVVTNNMIE